MASHANETNHSFKDIKLLKEVTKYSQLDAYETLYMKIYQDNLINDDPAPIQNSPFLSLTS